MDEISLLRQVRNDIPERDSAMVRRGRDALLMADPWVVATTQPRKSHARAAWLGFSAVGAFALTAALVATNVVGLAGWRGGADAAAAAVLEAAAVATTQTPDPIVGPGQYLLVHTSAVYMAGAQPDGGREEASKFGYFLETFEQDLYVPSDRSDDWVQYRPAKEVAQTFGPMSEGAAAVFPRDPEELLRGPAGGFLGGPADTSAQEYAALPRDPLRLLNWIYVETLGLGSSRDGEAFTWIGDQLKRGLVPADLRATMYRAAAMIPGVTSVENQANFDGRIGTAIRRAETEAGYDELIIDPVTGELIGERSVYLLASGEIQAGTAASWSAVTVRVVDSAPSGGSLYLPGDEPE